MRYEELREQALSSSVDQRATWGLTLFLRRGLVAWMQAWPETSSPEPRSEEPARQQPEVAMHFSAQLRDQVVSVLVNMFLHKQEEVFA
jgi:hypothetical protein